MNDEFLLTFNFISYLIIYNSYLILNLFRKLGLTTVFAVYFLILVGGIVRSTGSGMGCPDWPRCFGTWIPPTDVSQLPANYQEIFGAKLKGEVVFNVFKTWTEYINRLIGVLVGLFIFGTLLASIRYLKSDKRIFWLSLLAFVLVGFQGWLGSKVVSTELNEVLITLHMVLAIVIVFVLLYVVVRSYDGIIEVEKIENKPKINSILLLILGLSLVQIILGTQVRESIDVVAKQLGESFRSEWISHLGKSFIIHRSFSIIVLLSNFYLIYTLKKNIFQREIVFRLSKYMICIVLVAVFSGVLLANFSFPAFAQPIHLTLGTALIGIQFVIYLFLNQAKN